MSFIKLFRWLKGYVIVECTDENATAFINYLLKNGISIWNINRRGASTVFSMFVNDYKKIIEIRHQFKNKLKIHHIGTFGLPRKTRLFVKRKSIFIGLISFFTILIFMSSFIWNIEIVGNEKINRDEIISAYSELGVRTGIFKSQIDAYSLKEKFPLKIRDVSWCSFNIEGTKLTINITEIKETDKSEKNIYSNIVATSDGIVKEINLISGNKNINVGDVVAKGEILVSGAPELNSQSFTFSKGEIIAETYKNITISVPKKHTYFVRTGKISKLSVVNIFGFKIPLYLDKIHFENISKKSVSDLVILKKSLPISITNKHFYEMKQITENFDSINAYNEAIAKLINEIKELDIKSLELLENESEETETSYVYHFKLKCLENIAEVNQIHISS